MTKFEFMNAVATGEIFKNPTLAMECQEYAEEHKNEGLTRTNPVDVEAMNYIAELLVKKAMLAKEIEAALKKANIKVYDNYCDCTASRITTSKAAGLARKIPNVKMKDIAVKGENGGKYVATLYYIEQD